MRKEFEGKNFTQQEVDDWFDYARPQEVEDEVIWFNEPHHFEDVYFYLVKGEKKDLLIDTGMGIKPLRPILDKLRGPKKELMVANTHWHFDHIGGNREFPTVYIPFREYEIYGIHHGWSPTDLRKYFFQDGFWHGLPNNFNSNTFFVPSYETTKFIPDQFDLGGRIVRSIYTPGHTRGGVSFFDETYGILFTGDILYEGPLYAFEKESSPKYYLESLIQLSKLPFKTIHPGHNHADTKRFPNLIDEAIELFQRALNKESPDGPGEFPGTIEFHHKEYGEEGGRRLKIVIAT